MLGLTIFVNVYEEGPKLALEAGLAKTIRFTLELIMSLVNPVLLVCEASIALVASNPVGATQGMPNSGELEQYSNAIDPRVAVVCTVKLNVSEVTAEGIELVTETDLDASSRALLLCKGTINVNTNTHNTTILTSLLLVLFTSISITVKMKEIQCFDIKNSGHFRSRSFIAKLCCCFCNN